MGIGNKSVTLLHVELYFAINCCPQVFNFLHSMLYSEINCLKEGSKPDRQEFKGLLDSHAGLESAEVIELCPEHQVSQLCVCQEHDEEHDSKPQQVFSTAGDSAGQLAHSLIKIDELK